MKMKIGDREYPMRLTLGAMLRFHRETGKELNEAEVSLSMNMLTVLMWCCLVSACQADGVECDLTMEQMADRLDVKDVNRFASQLSEGQAVEAKKKENPPEVAEETAEASST
jgi:hypothetical protein